MKFLLLILLTGCTTCDDVLCFRESKAEKERKRAELETMFSDEELERMSERVVEIKRQRRGMK